MEPIQTEKQDHTEKIYIEASEWVRLANSVIWTMGTILIPVSFSAIGLALNQIESLKFDQRGKWFLAAGSILLFLFWVYVSYLYRHSATVARQVLISIEKDWGVRDEIALFTSHGMIGLKWYSLYNMQVVALIVLIVVWLIILLRACC